MNWNIDEIRQGARIATDLELYPISRRTTITNKTLRFTLEGHSTLLEDLYKLPSGRVDSIGYLPVRHLFYLLGFNESHPFRWRLEHKLVQALILNHYCPGSIPATSGVFQNRHHLNEMGHNELKDILSTHIIKRTQGFGTDPNDTKQTALAFDSIRPGLDPVFTSQVTDELWIIQERLNIDEEYRIHTIEDSVVDDLTYMRHSGRPLRSEREAPNAYLRSILSNLPNAFISNTICGWDIAKVGKEYRVIEVNFAGFYPFECRGFQCSGFLAQPVWGPAVFARLVRFVEKLYEINIACEYSVNASSAVTTLYWWIARWLDFFRLSEEIADFRLSMEGVHEPPMTQSTEYKAAELLTQIADRLYATAALIE